MIATSEFWKGLLIGMLIPVVPFIVFVCFWYHWDAFL